MTDDEKDAFAEMDRRDGLSRRDFLKVLASSFAALTAAGCKLRPPKEKILPYVEQPEDAVPGVAYWYASTCGACPAACGVLVKSRDGRPIKMEGNPAHPLSRGGLCARGQASVLDLYDGARLMHPLTGGKPSSWAALDAAVLAGLEDAARRGAGIRLLSHTVTSPALEAAIAAFLRRHPSARHVVYDPLSAAAIREAHRRTHGRAGLPHYRFDQARVIVGFDADFLGGWLSPVEFTKAWASNRRPGAGELMSWHAQFEGRLSLTGANADLRVPVRPSQELAAAAAVGRWVARDTGWTGPVPHLAEPEGIDPALLRRTAAMLAEARGRSLVVSGSADPGVQVVVNWINEMTGAYGHTLDVAQPSRQLRGEAGAFEGLVSEMRDGKVGALLVLEANPAYDDPRAADFAAALARVPLTVAVSQRHDETALLCRHAAAASHALENWGDAEPVAGVHSLVQPLVSPFFDTRSPLESMLAWSGRPGSAHDFVKERWHSEVFPRQKEFASFTPFWDAAVQRGVVATSPAAQRSGRFEPGALAKLGSGRPAAPAGSLELVAYASVSLADGRQANNPWLQELPDPVTKVSWGNAASLAPEDAARLGVVEGRMLRVSAGGRSVDLPAFIQPGQAPGTLAVALGYGRKAAGPIAANLPVVKLLPIEEDPPGGADAFPLSAAGSVAVALLPATVQLAKTQHQDSQTVPFTGQTREILRETTLEEYRRKGPARAAGEEAESSLWPRHEYKGHKWGMAVNLTACTGCAGCVVACQAENNVPVVGKAEVRRGREMHWIRIDRYYAEAPGGGSPDVGFQPMLCQHCDNAPCETVCPVLATVHSSEGANMQVYNRCVGTRYCANNCPYKVRRFNWFDYAHEDLLQNMALNQDVTVRSRGVMEKCSLCVQRIQSGKFAAKTEGRGLKDGDIVPACAQSCPAEAIVFGDLNDPDSRVARLARENRSYRALSELGVGPSVFYQVKVRNKEVPPA